MFQMWIELYDISLELLLLALLGVVCCGCSGCTLLLFCCRRRPIESTGGIELQNRTKEGLVETEEVDNATHPKQVTRRWSDVENAVDSNALGINPDHDDGEEVFVNQQDSDSLWESLNAEERKRDGSEGEDDGENQERKFYRRYHDDRQKRMAWHDGGDDDPATPATTEMGVMSEGDRAIVDALQRHRHVLQALRQAGFAIDPEKYREDRAYRAGVKTLQSAVERFGFDRVQVVIHQSLAAAAAATAAATPPSNRHHSGGGGGGGGNAAGVWGDNRGQEESLGSRNPHKQLSQQQQQQQQQFQQHRRHSAPLAADYSNPLVLPPEPARPPPPPPPPLAGHYHRELVELLRPMDVVSAVVSSGPPFLLSYGPRQHAVFPLALRCAAREVLLVAHRWAKRVEAAGDNDAVKEKRREAFKEDKEKEDDVEEREGSTATTTNTTAMASTTVALASIAATTSCPSYSKGYPSATQRTSPSGGGSGGDVRGALTSSSDVQLSTSLSPSSLFTSIRGGGTGRNRSNSNSSNTSSNSSISSSNNKSNNNSSRNGLDHPDHTLQQQGAVAAAAVAAGPSSPVAIPLLLWIHALSFLGFNFLDERGTSAAPCPLTPPSQELSLESVKRTASGGGHLSSTTLSRASSAKTVAAAVVAPAAAAVSSPSRNKRRTSWHPSSPSSPSAASSLAVAGTVVAAAAKAAPLPPSLTALALATEGEGTPKNKNKNKNTSRQSGGGGVGFRGGGDDGDDDGDGKETNKLATPTMLLLPPPCPAPASELLSPRPHRLSNVSEETNEGDERMSRTTVAVTRAHHQRYSGEKEAGQHEEGGEGGGGSCAEEGEARAVESGEAVRKRGGALNDHDDDDDDGGDDDDTKKTLKRIRSLSSRVDSGRTSSGVTAPDGEENDSDEDAAAEEEEEPEERLGSTARKVLDFLKGTLDSAAVSTTAAAANADGNGGITGSGSSSSSSNRGLSGNKDTAASTPTAEPAAVAAAAADTSSSAGAAVGAGRGAEAKAAAAVTAAAESPAAAVIDTRERSASMPLPAQHQHTQQHDARVEGVDTLVLTAATTPAVGLGGCAGGSQAHERSVTATTSAVSVGKSGWSDEARWRCLAYVWVHEAKRGLCASDPESRNLGALLLTSLSAVSRSVGTGPLPLLAQTSHDGGCGCGGCGCCGGGGGGGGGGRGARGGGEGGGSGGGGDGGSDRHLSWLRRWQCPRCTRNNRLGLEPSCTVCGLEAPQDELAHRIALGTLLDEWTVQPLPPPPPPAPRPATRAPPPTRLWSSSSGQRPASIDGGGGGGGGGGGVGGVGFGGGGGSQLRPQRRPSSPSSVRTFLEKWASLVGGGGGAEGAGDGSAAVSAGGGGQPPALLSLPHLLAPQQQQQSTTHYASTGPSVLTNGDRASSNNDHVGGGGGGFTPASGGGGGGGGGVGAGFFFSPGFAGFGASERSVDTPRDDDNSSTRPPWNPNNNTSSSAPAANAAFPTTPAAGIATNKGHAHDGHLFLSGSGDGVGGGRGGGRVCGPGPRSSSNGVGGRGELPHLLSFNSSTHALAVFAREISGNFQSTTVSTSAAPHGRQPRAEDGPVAAAAAAVETTHVQVYNEVLPSEFTALPPSTLLPSVVAVPGTRRRSLVEERSRALRTISSEAGLEHSQLAHPPSQLHVARPFTDSAMQLRTAYL